MNTKKLDKLRDKVYGILLIHINMKRSTELKPIIRNILNNTNDENTIINLGYINLIINHDKILTEIPLILFSSLISDELRIKGQEVGADEQITKPEIVELVNIIDRLRR